MDNTNIENHEIGTPWLSKLPPEILTLIGEQIYAFRLFKSLGALAQVCKAFEGIFMPILYSRRVVYIEKSWQSELPEVKENHVHPNNFLLPSTLLHTKDLEFHLIEDSKIDDDLVNYEELFGFVAQVLKMAPNLQSFRWSDQSILGDNFRLLALQESCVANKLKQQPRLKHLWIEYSTAMPDEKLTSSNCWHPLEGFSNLTSLDLYNFYGDKSHIAADLAQCLVNCPNLKSLGLGQGADLDFSYLWPTVIQTEDDDFLEQLCLLYQTRYKGSPLNLHTLRLGYGTSPYAPKLKNNHSYLKKLVSTKGLRNLDLFNGTWVKYLGGDPFDNLPIDYQLLNDCESLTDLSVTNFEDDVKGWLSDKRRSSIRKISAADYSHESLEPVYKLDLPNLSTIFTHMLLNEEPQDRSVDLPENDDHLNYYRHPILHSAVSKHTILDNFPNHGLQGLTRLKLCIHFETQWDHFCSRLADLNSLTQLRLDTLFGRRSPLIKVPSLAFRNAACETEIAYRYAQEISKIQLSLKYLMMSVPRRIKVAWEIIPVGQGVRGQRLRKLSLKKMDSFELFLDTLDDLEKPAGLPLESVWDAERQYPFLRWVPPEISDYHNGFFDPEPESGSSDSELFDSDSS